VNDIVVVVTRDVDDTTEVSWWLDTEAWHAGYPEMYIHGYVINGNARDLDPEAVVAAWRRLTVDRRADLSDLATHRVVDGVLTPIEGRAA